MLDRARAPGGLFGAAQTRMVPPELASPFRRVIPEELLLRKAESGVLRIVTLPRVHKVRRLVGAVLPAIEKQDRIKDQAPATA